MNMGALQKRRSIRKFQARNLDRDVLDKLAAAALLAPSSRGYKPWEFIFITEKELLEKLARAKHGAGLLAGAPLAVVIVADPEKSDVWIEDTSIAATILLYTAQELGLGACWVQIRKRMYTESITAEKYVAGILNIPEKYRITAIIGMGYPDETKPPHTAGGLNSEKIHRNRFGTGI